MGRYYQTFGRIGFGLAAMVMLGWFLWPSEVWAVEPEPLFSFGVALVVWIFAEFKKSEEVIFRDATPNDIRLGREMLAYSTWEFRELLKNHDYHRGIPPRFLSEASALMGEVELGTAFFQDRKVQDKFSSFSNELGRFVTYFGNHSSPEQYGANLLQAIIPYDLFDEYRISDKHRDEIKEANRLAEAAWGHFVPLISEIKHRIPEVFDEKVNGHWFRSGVE